jgi:hypothetical protein
MVAEFGQASQQWYILDSEIVKPIQVDLVVAVEGALRAENEGGFIDVIVGSAIIGSVLSAL